MRSDFNKDTKLHLVESAPVVEIKNVGKDFPGVRALNNVNLKIPEGRIIGLLGANGCGKTTLLKILAGFYTNYEGEALIDGQRPGAETKAKVAYLPDKDGLPGNMPVKDIISLYNTFFDDFDENKCMEILEMFDLNKEQLPENMSKGMVDKLQIALLMSRKARLYLLDEPIGGVDIEARDHVLDLILDNFNPEGSMIIVTHLIRDIERLFDSVIVMKHGEIVAFEDTDALRAQGNSLEEVLKEMF